MQTLVSGMGVQLISYNYLVIISVNFNYQLYHYMGYYFEITEFSFLLFLNQGNVTFFLSSSQKKQITQIFNFNIQNQSLKQ